MFISAQYEIITTYTIFADGLESPFFVSVTFVEIIFLVAAFVVDGEQCMGTSYTICTTVITIMSAGKPTRFSRGMKAPRLQP